MLLQPRTPVYMFLREQPWFETLPHNAKDTVVQETTLHKVDKGGLVLGTGQPITHWFGVLSGMVKLQSASGDGKVSAFLGVPTGDWFGEGSVLKGGAWRYDVIALRDTTLVGMPINTFKHLYSNHLPFVHYLVERLNNRLGQAMAVIESGRIRTPEERVAQYLSRLFWPGTRKINLSQEELGLLAGLSRQTTNRVLKSFEAQGWVSLEFGRLDILDENALDALCAREGNAPG
jgi:CRP-like cAMP-binding protein